MKSIEKIRKRLKLSGDGWDKDHYIFMCGDGFHSSFWKTVIESPQWQLWKKVMEKGEVPERDMPEVEECGWISPEHFQDFLKFVKSKSK